MADHMIVPHLAIFAAAVRWRLLLRGSSVSTAWAAAYASTVVLGRMTRVEGSTLALVWPAAAVGVLWLATRWHCRRWLIIDTGLLAVVAGAVNVATGTSVAMGFFFGVANVVQSLVACWVLRGWQLRSGAAPWRLRRSADLGALVIASLAGSAVAACIGPVALWLLEGAPLWSTMGAWTLRNAAGTFVFAALALRLADRKLAPVIRDRRQIAELIMAGAAVALGYTAVFGLTVQLPLAYLLVPLSMWLALRFHTTVAAAHVMLTGFFVVTLTLAGRGPFAVGDPWVQVLLAQAFVTVTGLVALVLALTRDERVQLIARLDEARRRADEQTGLLEQASQHKSAFLATMSHELRTPLNGVLGLLELLTQSNLDAEQAGWARAADRSGQALLGIVNDVLDNAKIEAGAVDLEQAPFDLRTVVEDAVTALRPVADEKQVSLTAAFAPALDCRRLGDGHRLRQVLTNLLGNAVKFTEVGSVTVTATGDHSSLRLTVADTGIGLTAEQQQRLFTPFAQADSSTTRRFGGTGLGLAIVQGLVQRMAGSITVHSSSGVGTTVTLELPLPGAGPVGTAVATHEDAEGRSAPLPAGLRVLVAEDNEVNQMIARAMLSRHGLDVDVVDNGAAAVDAAGTGRYVAVFMDCQMPVMDGLEATRRLRAAENLDAATTRRLPIIAMTAGAFETDRTACREAGMDAFLPKPWTKAQLAEALGQLVPQAAG